MSDSRAALCRNPHYMMGRALRALLVLLAATLFSYSAFAANNAKYAAIVVDVDTNQVLHQANADALRHPASLTKMMTLYLVFDALKKGRLSLNDQLTVSERAASMPATNLGLKGGEKISVETAIKALIVRSANDISVTFAEKLGKTEWQFAVMMTNKAQQLGMTRTVYRNPNGLPDVRQVTTARDQARLSIALRRDFPQYYRFFQTEDFTYRGATYHTHNRVMRDYPGADGLKTGYINMSGFNLATSVRRDGFSLVAVVLGGKTSRSRDDHMKDLLSRSLRQMADARRNGGKVVTTYASAEDAVEQPQARFSPVPVFKPGKEPATAPVETGMGDSAAAIELAARTGESTAQAVPQAGMQPQQQIAAYAPPVAPTSAPAAMQAGGWGIQVGAFSASRDAFIAAVNAQNIASRELQGAQIAIQNPKAGEGNIYRARIANMSEMQARRACRVLVARNEACFVFQDGNS